MINRNSQFALQAQISLRMQKKNPQRGVVLIVSLIMLVIMTLIGIAGVRLISSEERMVSYAFDRALSFQAAESALREIERKIDLAGRPEPAASSGCALTGTVPNNIMVCGTATLSVQRWNSASFADWTDTTVLGSGSLVVTPQYFVEYLGSSFPCELTNTLSAVTPSNCLRYRITSRASPSERSKVMLQSIYATYKP
jgi:type IV pilus assembly protein PilX